MFPKMIRIRNTNQIADLYVSAALYEELRGSRDIEALGEAEPLAFDDRGRLLPGQYGHE